MLTPDAQQTWLEATGSPATQSTKMRITRRDISVLIAMAGLRRATSPFEVLSAFDSQDGWEKYPGNPVLGGQYGTCFDVCVLHEAGAYKMWVSWRPKQSIALTESKDGIHWSPPEVVLGPDRGTGWEDDVNRPVVVHREDAYHIWYTGQANAGSVIGYATSRDGRRWAKQSAHPVLEPALPWEGLAVMCPHVMWDTKEKMWRLWYSAGEQYEPNAIGYATSADGFHWNKYAGNPVMTPERGAPWESQRVTAAQIIQWKGWYYSFYIGFRDINHAQIGLAWSKDGITNWCDTDALIERGISVEGNPILR